MRSAAARRRAQASGGREVALGAARARSRSASRSIAGAARGWRGRPRGAARRPARAPQPLGDLREPLRLEPEQHVRAVGDGHRPLGVVAQREARDAERRRLLLDAAGVGDDGRSAGLEGEELAVGERSARA